MKKHLASYLAFLFMVLVVGVVAASIRYLTTGQGRNATKRSFLLKCLALAGLGIGFYPFSIIFAFFSTKALFALYLIVGIIVGILLPQPIFLSGFLVSLPGLALYMWSITAMARNVGWDNVQWRLPGMHYALYVLAIFGSGVGALVARLPRQTITVGKMLKSIPMAIALFIAGSLAYKTMQGVLAPQRQPSNTRPMKTQVLIGSNALVKRLFVEAPEIGVVTDIKRGDLDPMQGIEIGIAGSSGILFLDDTGRIQKRMQFHGVPKTARVKIVDIDGDSSCEFIIVSRRGTVIDHDGKVIWSTPLDSPNDGISELAYGDADGDGVLEFIASRPSDIRLFDNAGHLFWNIPAYFPDPVSIGKVGERGNDVIVHSDTDFEKPGPTALIVLRDKKGNKIFSVKAKEVDFYGDSSLARYPSDKDPNFLLYATQNNKALLFDPVEGKIIAEFGVTSHIEDIVGMPVSFQRSKPPYFAIFGSTGSREILHVFDSNRKLVYHEVLADGGGSIAVIPAGDSTEEALLVGGNGRVYLYMAK